MRDRDGSQPAAPHQLGPAAQAGVRHRHAHLPELRRRGAQDHRGHPRAAGDREDPHPSRAEPGHKQSSGLFVPGEEPGRWPGAACKAGSAATASGAGARGGAGLKPPRLNTVWPVPALIDTACADLRVACGRAMLRARWARRSRMRFNPGAEAADQGQTRPRGSGETVRMGAAATICHDLTAAVGPSWLASVWSSGFRGRLNFLCATSTATTPG